MTVTEMDVLTATEIVEQCKVAVAVANAVGLVVMMLVHMTGMFVLFTKMEKMLNPSRLAAKARHQEMINRLYNR